MKETRFKDTEIGRIPEDWEVVHISDLAQNFTGLTYSPDNVREYGTLVLRSSNIQNGKLCYDDNVFVDMVIPERTKVKKDDILVCVRNGSARLIGKCAIIDEVKSETAFGAFMTILRSKNNINPYFVHYIWQSSPLQKQVQDNLGATINQITNKDIDNFVVSAPTKYEEQTRIASALTSIDNLISSLDKLIEKKKNIKQGTMQQLLTGKKRLKGFSEPWVEKQLGDCANVLYGFLFTPDYYTKTGKYKVATIGNVQEGKFYPDGCNNVNISSSFLNDYQYLKPGDLLISMTGNVGRVCIINADNYVMNYRVGKIVVNSDLCLQLLFHLLNQKGFIEDMLNKAKGAAQLNISKDDILSYSFLCPKSISEQSAIATVLSSMDEEISSLEAKRDKYASIKQGMMQQLLTGKIRLID